MVGGGRCPCRRCCQQWREILNIFSSAAKSMRSAAAVQSASRRPFRGRWGGGDIPSQCVMGGVQALCQCLSPPRMQHPLKEVHKHLSHTPKTLSKSTSGVASPGIFVNFCPKEPQKS